MFNPRRRSLEEIIKERKEKRDELRRGVVDTRPPKGLNFQG